MISSSAPTLTEFAAFGLHQSIRRGIADAGYAHARPIQAETIPAALLGRDILGLAETGTGKTAAYVLPLLHRIASSRKRTTLGLILAPTRELAAQIDAEIQALGRHTNVRSTTIYGGVPMAGQIRALKRRPQVLVACPGRLVDLYEQGFLDFSDVQMLVLDEADHMFDIGFLPAIRRILALLPERRQNLLFSATMSPDIRRLADGILSNPHVVKLSDSRPATTIEHAIYPIKSVHKRELLERLLEQKDCVTAIVFTRTKSRARGLAAHLERLGHRAVALQGNMSQSQRDRAMKGFRGNRYDVLVATDIVARGIDVSDISYVINFDAPNSPEAYTHRIGRTGRSEQAGRALTLVGLEDFEWIRATERHLGAPIEQRQFPGFEPIEIRGVGGVPVAPPIGGRRGSRARRPYGRRGGIRRAV